jgi:hypothetical protein
MQLPPEEVRDPHQGRSVATGNLATVGIDGLFLGKGRLGAYARSGKLTS